MPRTEETAEKPSHWHLLISGKGYKTISNLLRNHSESPYLQIEKTWKSGEPPQEWLALQLYSKSTSTTLSGEVHKRTQNDI